MHNLQYLEYYQPDNSGTIHDHQQWKKQTHDHNKAQISCVPLEFQISKQEKKVSAYIQIYIEIPQKNYLADNNCI